MKKVTGIGGIFFKTKDAKKLNEWYIQHLGFTQSGDGGILFEMMLLHRPIKEFFKRPEFTTLLIRNQFP